MWDVTCYGQRPHVHEFSLAWTWGNRTSGLKTRRESHQHPVYPERKHTNEYILLVCRGCFCIQDTVSCKWDFWMFCMLWRERPLNLSLACVASVSARVRRERWDESKKKRNDAGGGGRRKRCFLFSLPPPPSTIFFSCSRSNFRAITRLETLATQANLSLILLFLSFFLFSILLLLFSYFFTLVKGTVSRNSAKLGNYKIPIKLRETYK